MVELEESALLSPLDDSFEIAVRSRPHDCCYSARGGRERRHAPHRRRDIAPKLPRNVSVPPPFLPSIMLRAAKRRRRAAAGRTSATKSRPVGKKREARRRRRRSSRRRSGRAAREEEKRAGWKEEEEEDEKEDLSGSRTIARRDDRDKEANVNEADRPRIARGSRQDSLIPISSGHDEPGRIRDREREMN